MSETDCDQSIAVRPVSVQVAGISGTCAALPVWAQAVRVTEVTPDTSHFPAAQNLLPFGTDGGRKALRPVWAAGLSPDEA